MNNHQTLFRMLTIGKKYGWKTVGGIAKLHGIFVNFEFLCKMLHHKGLNMTFCQEEIKKLRKIKIRVVFLRFDS